MTGLLARRRILSLERLPIQKCFPNCFNALSNVPRELLGTAKRTVGGLALNPRFRHRLASPYGANRATFPGRKIGGFIGGQDPQEGHGRGREWINLSLLSLSLSLLRILVFRPGSGLVIDNTIRPFNAARPRPSRANLQSPRLTQASFLDPAASRSSKPSSSHVPRWLLAVPLSSLRYPPGRWCGVAPSICSAVWFECGSPAGREQKPTARMEQPSSPRNTSSPGCIPRPEWSGLSSAACNHTTPELNSPIITSLYHVEFFLRFRACGSFVNTPRPGSLQLATSFRPCCPHSPPSRCLLLMQDPAHRLGTRPSTPSPQRVHAVALAWHGRKWYGQTLNGRIMAGPGRSSRRQCP